MGRPLSHDAHGQLFDPQVRTMLTRFTAGHDLDVMEAASALRSAAQSIERLRARGVRGAAVSAAALDLLLYVCLHDQPAVRMTELARLAGVTPRNVTGLIDALEYGGLVARTPDPADRRATLVQGTPRGRATVEHLADPSRRAMTRLFQTFASEEVTLLRHLCLQLVGTLDDLT